MFALGANIYVRPRSEHICSFFERSRAFFEQILIMFALGEQVVHFAVICPVELGSQQ